MSFPINKYNIIYADPPWPHKTWTKKGLKRSAERHYDTMSIEDIKALPVEFCSADDCALFMWVTDPLLDVGIDVLKAWGFVYKTVAFTWVKKNRVKDSFFIGMGRWTRSNPEMCLLGTRGRPERIGFDVQQLIIDKRREHSRKPKEARNRIRRLVKGNCIELFAREKTPGWDVWGNETTKFSEAV